MAEDQQIPIAEELGDLPVTEQIPDAATMTDHPITALIVVTPDTTGQDAATETETVEAEVVETEPPHIPFYRRRIPLPMYITATIFLLVGSTIISFFVVPLFVLSATITIVPDAKTVNSTISMELPSIHPLTKVTAVLSHTVPTTATGYQKAAVATGYVTFYNAAPYPQTIPAGTLLTSSSGVDIVTDDTIVIPAGNFSTNGSQTVGAQTVNTGASQNIPAYAIASSCCREDVFVRNNAPFTGGADARTFKVVAKSDIENATSTLMVTALGKAENNLQAEILPQEDTTTPSCSPKITANHQVGAEATSVTVQVTATCSAFAFDRASFDAALSPTFLAAVGSHIPTTYGSVGGVSAAITGVAKKAAGYVLTMQATGTFAYAFTKQQKQAMERLIAGKTRTQGVIALMHIPGVERADIAIWPQGETLPQNSTRIQVVIADEP